MVEYVLLLAASTGGQWVERATNAFNDDPVLVWGMIAAVVVLMAWVLKPNR